jgi:hypothetical protein
MAEVEVTINGVIYDKTQRTARPVVIVGSASLTDLGVGGGPIPPGHAPDRPRPTPPVAGWPDYPGQPGPPGSPGWGRPPSPGGPPLGTWGGDSPWPGYATPPIYLPPEPIEPPPGGGDSAGSIVKPPPATGGWAYSPEFGWGYFPMKGGKPTPPPGPEMPPAVPGTK